MEGPGAYLFTLVTSYRIQENDMKLEIGEVQPGYEKKVLYQRVIGHWNMLPTEVVTTPSLPQFLKHLDNNLVIYGLIFGLSCSKPGVGLDNHYPTQYIL